MTVPQNDLSVPPIFSAVAIDPDRDPFAAARDMAMDGANPATIVWTPQGDRADCAVILSPDAALTPSLLVTYVVMNAIGDTLGALIPPVIPLAFGWPDRILMNGATVGGLRADWPKPETPDAVPEWMVLGVTLVMRPASDEDAPRLANQTTMVEEGCVELTPVDILESFSRHLLYWMNRWQDESFGPIKAAWLARAAGYGSNTDLETGGDWAGRKLLSLQVDGSVQYSDDGDETTETLEHALRHPTWQSQRPENA